MSKPGKHQRYNMPFYKLVGGFGKRGHRTRVDQFKEEEIALEYRREQNEKARWWNEQRESSEISKE